MELLVVLFLYKLFAHVKIFKNEIKVKIDLSSYATTSDLKYATGVDTLDFAKKAYLANLKSEGDKLYIDKLAELNADKWKPVPVNLKQLSDVVDNNVKKTVYDGLIKKVNFVILWDFLMS